MTVRHLLADDDLSADEQAMILDLAARMKDEPFAVRTYEGPRSVAVLFDKPTLRTQSSFAAGIAELGGFPLVVDARLAGIGKRESVADVARVLGRQAAAIVWRTFAQDDLAEMAAYAGVPVVNALTDDFHPCQILADLLTIREHAGALSGVTLTYTGDGANNMANSYLLGGALAGLHVRIAAPEGFQPDPAIVRRAGRIADTTGGSVQSPTRSRTRRPAPTCSPPTRGCRWGWRRPAPTPRQSSGRTPWTAQLLARANRDAIVLHCLPAYRGKEISADVIDGPPVARVGRGRESTARPEGGAGVLGRAGRRGQRPAGEHQ